MGQLSYTKHEYFLFRPKWIAQGYYKVLEYNDYIWITLLIII